MFKQIFRAPANDNVYENLVLLFALGTLIYAGSLLANLSSQSTSALLLVANGLSSLFCLVIAALLFRYSLDKRYTDAIVTLGITTLLVNAMVRFPSTEELALSFYFFFLLAGLLTSNLGWMLFNLTLALLSAAATALIYQTSFTISPIFLGLTVTFAVFIYAQKSGEKLAASQQKRRQVFEDNERLLRQLERAVEQRNHALQRLSETRQMIEDIVTRAPVPMAIHSKGIITYVNAAFCDCFRSKSVELRNRPVSELLEVDDPGWLDNRNALMTEMALRSGRFSNCLVSNIALSSQEPEFLLVLSTEEHMHRLPDEPLLPSAGEESTISNDSCLRVMVAEDNRVNMEIVCAMVEKMGFAEVVTRATDGEEAIDLLAEAQPDVLLLDLSMPVMDGFEVAQRLVEQPVSNKTVVVAVSAHADALTREKALACGVDDYITKPIMYDELHQKLLELHRQSVLMTGR